VIRTSQVGTTIHEDTIRDKPGHRLGIYITTSGRSVRSRADDAILSPHSSLRLQFSNNLSSVSLSDPNAVIKRLVAPQTRRQRTYSTNPPTQACARRRAALTLDVVLFLEPEDVLQHNLPRTYLCWSQDKPCSAGTVTGLWWQGTSRRTKTIAARSWSTVGTDKAMSCSWTILMADALSTPREVQELGL
jgi:hypothetical protein